MIKLAVEMVNRSHDGIFQTADCLEVVVVDCGSFQVPPEAFDQIEVRCVGRVPDHAETGSLGVRELPHCLGVVDRTIVQKEINTLVLHGYRIDLFGLGRFR